MRCVRACSIWIHTLSPHQFVQCILDCRLMILLCIASMIIHQFLFCSSQLTSSGQTLKLGTCSAPLSMTSQQLPFHLDWFLHSTLSTCSMADRNLLWHLDDLSSLPHWGCSTPTKAAKLDALCHQIQSLVCQWFPSMQQCKNSPLC